MKKYYAKQLAFWFILVLAGSAAVYCQKLFDDKKALQPFVEPTVIAPSVVRAADLGLHNAAGDLAWLAAIQYFGGNDSSTKLGDYLSLSTELDPKFSYPYAFGTLMLPSFDQTNQAITLAKKGIAEADPDWQIPYYLAVAYHLNLEDPVNAAKYFDQAAKTPGAPANIQAIAANYGSRSDIRSQTKQIWLGILETTNDKVVKERAQRYVAHFELMDFLETAAKEYYKRNNKYPTELQDLVSSKIIASIPIDPFGLELTFKDDGTVMLK